MRSGRWSITRDRRRTRERQGVEGRGGERLGSREARIHATLARNVVANEQARHTLFDEEGHDQPWLIATVSAAAIGSAVGRFARPDRVTLYAAAIPWLAALAFNLANASAPGGALWPISQLLVGTFAAVVGVIAARLVRRARGQTTR
jgi:hypothetical protein